MVTLSSARNIVSCFTLFYIIGQNQIIINMETWIFVYTADDKLFRQRLYLSTFSWKKGTTSTKMFKVKKNYWKVASEQGFINMTNTCICLFIFFVIFSSFSFKGILTSCSFLSTFISRTHTFKCPAMSSSPGYTRAGYR